MNILYLCDEYPPCQHGGIGTVTQTLARSLAKKGHTVVVAGFYPYYRKAVENENDNGVNVYRFFYGSKLLLQFSKRNFLGRFINIENQFNKYIIYLKKIIIENKIEIIESPDFLEAFRYSGPSMIQYPTFGIPFIVKLHGSYTIVNDYSKDNFGHANIQIKEQNLLNFANGLVAVSDSVKERVEERFRIFNKIYVLYNGVLVAKDIKYQPNLTKDNVVFAGTLSESKGVFNLIKAWDKVIQVRPSAQLLLYGKGSSITISAINKLIKYNIKSSIILMGYIEREHLPSIFANAACAIFPSFAETFGMAPIEAMATGCPTIFTKRTSGPEIIENGVDGLLIDPNDEQEIADAILMLLTNRELAFEIGQNGINKVRSNFDIDIIAEKHISFYEGFLQKY